MQEQPDTLFECDPYKNTECSKTGCFLRGGECYQTKHLKYARVTHPSGYAELQKRQTAEIYAKVDSEALAKARLNASIEKIFATRLRVAMYNSGVNQTELASKAGISVQTASLLVNGKVLPTSRNLAKLAIALHVSCDYLLGLSNTPAGHFTGKELER